MIWIIGWVVLAIIIGLPLGSFIRTASSDKNYVARLRKAGL